MSPSGLIVLGTILGVCLALLVIQAIRHPLLVRLSLRNAARRPGESALVIAGSLLGAAIITGSFIVGDTLDSSIRSAVRTQVGPVDEVISVPGSKQLELIFETIEQLDHPDIDGIDNLLVAKGPVSSKIGESTLAEPSAQIIELDFASAGKFGGDQPATGIEGITPSATEVVLTEPLASTLEVAPGDPVSIYLYGQVLDREVAHVLPQHGLAGFWLGFETTSLNAFVSPGTITEVSDEPGPGAAPPEAYVIVSNRGGVEEGAESTEVVVTAIEEALEPLGEFRVEPVKQDRLDDAADAGAQFSELFIGIGSFAVLAGILLLINIFVMLSEERKSQLGMLRAIGMRRGDLIRAFVLEGSGYGLAASALGALLGIGVGWAIVKLAAPIFGSFGDFSLDLNLSASPSSVFGGFLIGALISLTTITATSFRISRVNIIRAIRELPEPPAARGRLRSMIAGIVLAIASAAWFAVSLGNGDAGWAGALLGPPLVVFGLLPAALRTIPRVIAVRVAASLGLFWGIFGNAILDDSFFGSGEIFAFVLQGVLLTFSAVILLSHSQEALGTGIRKLAARNLPLRLGLAYPLARRFRTGLTLGMFALVMFTMIFLAVMATIFGGQIETFTERSAGGFDIVVTSAPGNPPSLADIAEVDGVDGVSGLTSGVTLFRVPGAEDSSPWPVSGIDRSFVTIGPPTLEEERAPGLGSDEEVWAAVLDDPSNVVIPAFFLQTGGGPPESVVEPGDDLTVIDPATGRSVERTVVGVVSEDVSFSGVFMSRVSLDEVLGRRAAPARFMVVAEGTEAEARVAAARLQGELLENGVQADTFRSLVEEFGQLNLQFLRLMQGYLALGLVVGIAGLGVVMVRAVRDRRREIGVLRSLGLVAAGVRRAFIFESAFIAVEGVLIGTTLALITASQLVATGSFGEGVDFDIPWGQVTFLSGAAVVASIAATLWPAHQASNIPPAVALRVAD